MIVEFHGGVLDGHQEHAPDAANWELVKKLAVYNKRTSRVVGCYLRDVHASYVTTAEGGVQALASFVDTQDRAHWTIAPGEAARVIWLDVEVPH